MHAPEARLSQVIDRFEQVEARLGAAGDPDEIVKLSKEHAELKPVAEKASELRAARAELDDLAEMMEGGDAEMADMAREEYYALKERLPELEHEMSLLLLPKDKDDSADALIEIRAGTGGDEAALFAGDLYAMYQRYAQLRGWSWELVSASEGEHGGYKEVIAQVSGNGVFGRLKFESGVHRVQRVPATESQGRIHTSAATVAIMPKPEEVDFDLDMSEVRVDEKLRKVGGRCAAISSSSSGCKSLSSGLGSALSTAATGAAEHAPANVGCSGSGIGTNGFDGFVCGMRFLCCFGSIADSGDCFGSIAESGDTDGVGVGVGDGS